MKNCYSDFTNALESLEIIQESMPEYDCRKDLLNGVAELLSRLSHLSHLIEAEGSVSEFGVIMRGKNKGQSIDKINVTIEEIERKRNPNIELGTIGVLLNDSKNPPVHYYVDTIWGDGELKLFPVGASLFNCPAELEPLICHVYPEEFWALT